jgi:hypothetical protein
MWVFVLFEGCIFASYFIIYMLYRMRNPLLFLHSQAKLSQGFGAANTLILLTSSWLIARCVQSSREHDYTPPRASNGRSRYGTAMSSRPMNSSGFTTSSRPSMFYTS